MTDFLLKLCGLKIDGASRVSGVDFALRNSAWLPWALVLAVALGALAWWSYWRDSRELLPPGKRRFLTGLRFALFALLLLLLLRPVVAFTVQSSIRRTLLTLVDSSSSMRIADARTDPADLQRAAIATGLLDVRKGLAQPLDPAKAASLRAIPRMQIVREMLNSPALSLWPEFQRQLDIASFSFGQTLVDIPAAPAVKGRSAPWLDSLVPDATATALGDSIRELLNRKRGQPLAGIFLVTDGANNFGSPPLDAARLAQQEGVPLFIYGVGITLPRDIIVGPLTTQEIAFVNDTVTATVRVRSQGLRAENGQLQVRLVPIRDGVPEGEGEVVFQKDIALADDAETTESIAFTPKTTGAFELTAGIAARPDEAAADNNTAGQRIRVVDSKIKVLYVETAPRWEFRYLHTNLLRDRRLELKTVLLEGDASLAEGPSSPFLPAIPDKKEDLLRYDLIIIGDVAAERLTKAQHLALEEYVQRFSGTLLFIAGPRHSPSTYLATPFEKLLPVELHTIPPAALPPNTPIQAELTPQGRSHPMLRLAEAEADNTLAWRTLPPLYWVAPVSRAKPAAQVLLVDSDATRATRTGKPVIAAEHSYGLGRVLWIGTDNTWRWRKNTTERLHTIFWGQLAQSLGMHHLLSGSRLTQLATDKQTYVAGERVVITGRLYAPDFTPLREPSVPASLAIDKNTASQEILLRADPANPGAYRAEFIAKTPGTYRITTARDPASALEFQTTPPRYESGDTAMNETALRQLAEISGGAFFREETLHELPAAITARADRITTVVDGELWASPLVFLLALVLASTEWLLRKKWQLK